MAYRLVKEPNTSVDVLQKEFSAMELTHQHRIRNALNQQANILAFIQYELKHLQTFDATLKRVKEKHAQDSTECLKKALNAVEVVYDTNMDHVYTTALYDPKDPTFIIDQMIVAL